MCPLERERDEVAVPSVDQTVAPLCSSVDLQYANLWSSDADDDVQGERVTEKIESIQSNACGALTIRGGGNAESDAEAIINKQSCPRFFRNYYRVGW